MKIVPTIRPEQNGDVDQIRFVNETAFGRPLEAAIVDALRGLEGALSFVALTERRVVGHILFTPVQVEHPATGLSAVGLAPVAVLPEHQRQGIGARLVTAGLAACRARGSALVVVLGHPDYYPRFGFVRASTKRLACEYPVPDEAFMVCELQPGALDRVAGVVRYRPEFACA